MRKMFIGSYALALVLISVAALADDLLPSDVEFKAVGVQTVPDPQLGFRGVPDSRQEVTKFVRGKEVSKTNSTLGPNGFRISSASGKAGKKEHFLLIGGSIIFGSGLNDDETLAHWANVRSTHFEVYPVSLLGYQLPHQWMLFKNGDLPQKITQKKGRAIIYLNSGSVLGAAGDVSQLPIIENWPLLRKNASGEFEFAGLFSQAAGLRDRLLLKFCVPVAACRSFISGNPEPTEAQLRTSAAMIESLAQMYKTQFEVDDFRIAWGDPSDVQVKMLSTMTSIPVFHWKRRGKTVDGHPDAEGIKQMADDLFDAKVIF